EQAMQPMTIHYHGTRADLVPGDSIVPGHPSNYGRRRHSRYVYLSELLEPAIWAAELAVGEGPGRIYIVQPTGSLEDDTNLTNTRYPGNPTRSYRCAHPLRVVAEVRGWIGHTPERIAQMREFIATLGDRADPIED